MTCEEQLVLADLDTAVVNAKSKGTKDLQTGIGTPHFVHVDFDDVLTTVPGVVQARGYALHRLDC